MGGYKQTTIWIGRKMKMRTNEEKNTLAQIIKYKVECNSCFTPCPHGKSCKVSSINCKACEHFIKDIEVFRVIRCSYKQDQIKFRNTDKFAPASCEECNRRFVCNDHSRILELKRICPSRYNEVKCIVYNSTIPLIEEFEVAIAPI